MAKYAVAVLTLILLITVCSAQDSETGFTDKPIIIQRITSPVKLDGLSNDAAWKGIESLPMIMRIPEFGTEPTERTEILLGYDDDFLYAAGRFYESDPSKIQAISFKRDIWTYSSDYMGIVIDAFNDNENSNLFFAGPAGTRTDVNFKNDGEGRNTSWNTFWDVETVINDTGWFAEMRIPFSSLRFEEHDGQTKMSITAIRYIARKSESITFPLIPEKFGFWGNFKASQTQEVLFKGIKNKNPLYITPYLLGGLGQSHELKDDGTDYQRNNKFEREAGLDIKYGLTNNLTLDITVNTDFAQAEADDRMINLSRYSLFFPEKRLFFQERQGNFDFGFHGNNRLFYSRRIGLHEGNKVRIYGGARIVGRAGKWDIGFLNMQTQKFEDLLSENFNVMRTRRQVINEYSYIGGMFTSRIGNKNNWNTAYGIDGIFRLFGDDYLTLKWAQSFENHSTNKLNSLDPSRIFVNWNRRGKKGLGYNLSYSRSGSAFNPGIGYERRNNYTRFGDRIQYGWFPGEISRLQDHQVFIEGITFLRNEDGKKESSEIGPGWEFTTKSNSTGLIVFKQYTDNVPKLFKLTNDAEIPEGNYTWYGFELEYVHLKASPYRIGTSVEAGTFYDGRRASIRIWPQANISAHLQLNGEYVITVGDFLERDQQFIWHIGSLTISAFLNTKLSLVSRFQYDSSIDKILTNIRFRYNPREGHDLYIVYDEGLNMDRHREIPVLPPTNIRTILVKYSYTFLL